MIFICINKIHHVTSCNLITNFMTTPLRETPKDVDTIVRKEQLRIEVDEDIKLKKEQVYYRIVREWDKLNSKKITK